ncbi:MAG: response regulator transcription factor [Actinomycetota bacterium]
MSRSEGGEVGSEDVRAVVVDDHNVVRSGLKLLIDSQDGMSVVGDAQSGEEALRLLDSLFGADEDVRPNVVVMDLMMAGIGGVEATRRIKDERPELNVLILTMNDDRAYLREAFRAGASGYVLKEAVDLELIDALRAVAAGGRYLHPSLGAELIRAEEEASRGPKTEHGIPLSAREVDVIRLVAAGYSNKEIADELYISVRTVETHKTHIMQKTGLRARSELTRFASESGILDSGP